LITDEVDKSGRPWIAASQPPSGSRTQRGLPKLKRERRTATPGLGALAESRRPEMTTAHNHVAYVMPSAHRPSFLHELLVLLAANHSDPYVTLSPTAATWVDTDR